MCVYLVANFEIKMFIICNTPLRVNPIRVHTSQILSGVLFSGMDRRDKKQYV